MQLGYIPRIIPEQVRYLEPRFISNPKKMIDDFSLTHDFEICRDQLWAMLKGFFASPYADDCNGMDRSDYLFFYEQLAALLEAIFLLHEERMKKKNK